MIQFFRDRIENGAGSSPELAVETEEIRPCKAKINMCVIEANLYSENLAPKKEIIISFTAVFKKIISRDLPMMCGLLS